MGDGHRRRRHDRSPAVLQVLRVLHRQRDEHGGGARPAAEPAADPGRAADRGLVLHVHGDQLRRRRLPPAVPARVVDRRHAVPVVLPAPGGRTDRAARGADPPAGRAPRRTPCRCGGRRLADPGRSVQEGRDRQLPGDRDRGSGLQRARPTRVAGDPRRHRRLRGADLLRLQRLHRHRHRDREAARVPVPPELRPSLQRPLDPGVLASLAHDAVALAARLPLHPARWEPQGHRAHLREPDDHDAARRSVARRGVALRGLGRTARRLPRDRSMETLAAGAGGPRSRAGRALGVCAAGGELPSGSSALPGCSSGRTRSARR